MNENQIPQNDNNLVNTGYLKIRVSTANEAVPLKGALVTVEYLKDGVPVKFEYTTDSSGLVDLIEIPSPPPDLSLDSTSSQIPYSTVDVKANVDGFIPIIAKNVPIFPNRVSIQNFFMNPKTNNDNVPEIIIEKEPNL